MKFSFNKIIGLLLVTGLLGCKIGDDDQPLRDLFEFNQIISIDPVKKEYNKGDIFWMEVNVPSKVWEDLNTGEMVTVGNAIFTLNTRMETVSADPMPTDTVLFDLLVENGEAERGENFSQRGEVTASFGCPESSYALRFGLQLNDVGNYVLILNDLNLFTLILFTAGTDCNIHNSIPPPDDADQAFVRFAFDESDVNLDVFDELMESEFDPNSAYYRDLLERKFAFFLKVR